MPGYWPARTQEPIGTHYREVVDLPKLDWLPWRQAIALAVALLVVSQVIDIVRRRSRRRGARSASTSIVSREAALVLFLYSVWQYVGGINFGGLDQADAAGLWLADLESALGWPTEAAIQRVVLGNDALIRLADLYYSSLHIPVFVMTLVWILLFRRQYWAFSRTTIAILTGLCLLIQFKPVAPPRLLPQLGVVDTAALHGLSVYGLIPGANQYSAMPSVHIAWAAAVAFLVVIAGRTLWRWLALLYPLATLWVVVVTGNHFIIDGVASITLLGASAGITVLFQSQRPPGFPRSHARVEDLDVAARPAETPPAALLKQSMQPDLRM